MKREENFIFMKLREGKKYDFTVEKILEVGANAFYLLKGPGGGKYLLPKKTYEHYGIKLKSVINCRVDKINCQGEVFLEPPNPYYEEGKEYDFEVSGHDIRVNEVGEMVRGLLLKDKFANELILPLANAGGYDIPIGGYIRLKVRKITKGKLVFTETRDKQSSVPLQEDRVNEFYIYDKMRGTDGKEYFLIRDNNNSHHILPAKQYSYYGLETGKTFKARLISYHNTGRYKIEPLNPYYEPGKEYEFDLISETGKPGSDEKILLLSDKHGLRHEAKVPGDYTVAKRIRLRVEKIRKGRPLLVVPK